MSSQESKILRIQLFHPLIGVHNFDISSKDNFSDLRTMLSENTQMAIFQNFRFTFNGKLLPEFQEVGQVVLNETRINLVLEPFDEKSSHYHLQRVRQILSNPIQWVVLNSRDSCEQKEQPMLRLPPSVNIDNFLDSQLSSPLYQSQVSTPQHIVFLQQIIFSSHNPPPMHRRLAGDFFYLLVRTLQGHQEHVTACSQGFYINGSTNSHFSTTNHLNVYFYNLLDLFKYLSPRFKQQFNNIKKVYKMTDLDKSILNSFKSAPYCEWLRCPSDNPSKRTKYNQWKHLTFNSSNQNATIKQWNQIIQMHSILLTDSQADVSNKQKNQYKLYQQFVSFAKESAVKAVDGLISPINPQAPFSKRVFCYGSVGIWFAEDNPNSYAKIENSRPTKKALSIQLRNLEMMEKLKTFNINFQHMVLVNYKGYNVVIQPLISGIPANPSISLNPSAIAKGEKTIQQMAKLLRIESQNVIKNSEGKAEKAHVHPQLHYFKADDKRNYLLNLHALSPRDLNFLGDKNTACVIRRELISSFNQKQNCYKNVNTVIQSGYNLIFNQRAHEQQMKMRSVKTYAEEIVVPLVIKSFLRQNKKYLADSKSVVKVMHQFGLSSRYLGAIHRRAPDFQAYHMQVIIERVILVKTIKNILRQAMRKAEFGDIKQTICRIFNCIFCNETTLASSVENYSKDQLKDEISTNASRKKKKKQQVDWQVQQQANFIRPSSQIYGSIKPNQLWQQIQQVANFRYGLNLNKKKISSLKCMQNQYGKSATLRDICICVGICLQKTQYFQRQGILFKPEHIEQIKPLAKSISISNRYFQNLISQGDSCIQKKRVEEAIDYYNQAINYTTSVFGIMTEDLAKLNKKMAQIYFRIGEMDAAMLLIHCAVRMCEKIYGQSHVQTLQCYSLSSQFNFFSKNFQTAEYYLIKAIQISTVSYGEQYPELIIYYLNLGTIYESVSRFMDSITCNSHALKLVLEIYNENHINTAICYAAMSTAHFQVPDIEKAIFFQEKCIQILKVILKEDDPKLKEAQKVLQHYNHLQSSKKVKQNHEKERKKLISNPQLFAGFPLFRFPDLNCSPKDREMMFRRMQSMMHPQGKFFI